MQALNRALLIVLFLAAAVIAQEPNEPTEQAPPPPEAAETPDAPDAPETRGAAAGEISDVDADAPNPRQTMREMMELRDESPVVEPVRTPQVQYVPSRIGVPAATVDVDHSILGIAPGEETPTLRREGEFVISRRGRLIRSPDGAHVLFAFEADDKDSPEPPMILQACQWLETMETIVQQRGDSVVFIVTGQIHTYRGANYLLPTMVKQAIDQGNLKN